MIPAGPRGWLPQTMLKLRYIGGFTACQWILHDCRGGEDRVELPQNALQERHGGGLALAARAASVDHITMFTVSILGQAVTCMCSLAPVLALSSYDLNAQEYSLR